MQEYQVPKMMTEQEEQQMFNFERKKSIDVMNQNQEQEVLA